MFVEEIGTDDLRRMVKSGRLSDVVAVGLPGAWAINIVSDDCAAAAMTLRPQHVAAALHARYWDSLEQLDQFLQEIGIAAYSVDRTLYRKELPPLSRDSDYFPSGPEEFLDHEFVAYLRGFVRKGH
jgi:hypothetical protein